MHMADALISPAVGGAMWAVSAGAIAYCSRKVREELDDNKVPLMGVLGAFLFATQMINFTIPVTGSSGHLGGGLLLAILLGPYAALLAIASVLVVQALFFADGGLLALGCNIFNMGIIPALIVYPLVYRKIIGPDQEQKRRTVAIMGSAIAALQLGPFGVVLETWLSGISSLPFSAFALLMQPIHLAIGIVEGFVTAGIVAFVLNARPEILQPEARSPGSHPMRRVLIPFLVTAFLCGGMVSWFASRNPDGLEWAIARVTGKQGLEGPKQGVHGAVAAVQEMTAFLPDYSFKRPVGSSKQEAQPAGAVTREAAQPAGGQEKGGAGKFGTTVAGVVGTLMVLVLAFFSGIAVRKRNLPAR